MTEPGRWGDRRIAAALAVGMFLVYNANGREIGSYDSQPSKFAARELLLRGTLALNYVVGRTPQLLERTGFQFARDGRYRSARSPVPPIIAAATAWPLWATGVLDLRAPRAPGVIAKLAASVLVACAVGLAYLIARRGVSRVRAIFIATAFGLGTGLWNTASQTLWQHESVIFGFTLAVFGLMRANTSAAILIGIGVGLAATSRLHVVPSALVVLAGATWILGWRLGAIAAAIAALVIIPLFIMNVRWFGSILGAAPLMEALNLKDHATTEVFKLQWEGFAGLLVSPNRGLLVFSPIAGLAAFGLPRLLKEHWRGPAAVCLAAAVAQFTLYASYSVWWGGHTYGPRYMLDVLPLVIPLAILAAAAFNSRIAASGAALALAYSMGVAGLGAFHHPHERWNSDPADVDTHHERLWDWSDNQIRRAWSAGPSPQNFSLFTREAFRVPPPQ